MKKIFDIIIPAYHAHNTIGKTLGSILCQSILDRCSITIVNDGDEKDYSEFISIFNEYMDIREIGYKDNRGPGQARQYAIDNTSCPYIVFVDADDMFYGALALEIYLQHLKKILEPCSILVNSFYQTSYEPDLNLKIVPPNMTWLFAKVYNREFINKHNIRFGEQRANEDAAFNTLYEICVSEDKTYKQVILQTPQYCWIYNPNSITRVNNCEFFIKDNLLTYVDSIIYGIKESEKRFPNSKLVLERKIEIMVFLYFVFCQLSYKDTRYVKKNIFAIVKYYNEIFKDCEKEDAEYLNKKFIEFSNLRQEMLKDILPDLTFKQLLNSIRSAKYDPNMQID